MKYPPFDAIDASHYAPAFEQGMAEQQTEMDAIANQTEPATLENTLIAMERSGETLDRVRTVFSAMTSAHTNDNLEAVRSEMAPKLSAHRDKILRRFAPFAPPFRIHRLR